MNGMTVYHGSYAPVELPDLAKCEEGKDFGKGFYVTSCQSQAERLCKTAVGKAFKNGRIPERQTAGYVSVFEVRLRDGLSIYEFADADAAWLRCVGAHRRRDLFENGLEGWKEYDIIAGKIANDTTNRVITNFINGDYGNPESDSAVRFAISLLKPDRLSDQECFRTQSAIACLHFVKSYEVEIQ